MRIAIILFLSFSLFLKVEGQSIPSFGNPFVHNYDKSQYKAGNQNWSLVQGQDGVMYFANNEGLLSFDGSYWELYPLSNRNFVRSVAIGPEGRIYVGGKEEFGYFEKINGRLRYHKLSQSLEPALMENDEIWKIQILKDSILFQAFSKLYIYSDNKIETYYGGGEPFLFIHQVNGNIWMEKIPSGLHQWSDNRLTLLDKLPKNILTILPYSDKEYLLGTSKEGLYILHKDGSCKPWKIDEEAHKILSESQLNNGIKIDDYTFAFGTIKNGILIIDSNGQLKQHIHKKNGLQNNTVLSLTLDRQGNIWAGLDNGIDRIEINSPLYYYKDIFGELGTVYAIKVFRDKIYLGTNQGLFYSQWHPQSENRTLNFKFVEKSQGQVWTLDVFNDQLICGHNEGTFVVNDERLKQISELTGGWANVKVAENAEFFLQGNYTGLAVFQDQKGWTLREKFQDWKAAVYHLSPKERYSYWAVFNKSIQLISFSPDFSKVSVDSKFLFSTDFPNIKRITPISIQGKTFFMTDKGIFVYDSILSKFISYDGFNNVLGTYVNSSKLKKLDNNSYIFANQGNFATVKFDNNQIIVDSTSFNSLQNLVMKNYEIIESVDKHVLFGLDNGIAIYHPLTSLDDTISAPIIKGVQNLSVTGDSIHYVTPYNFLENNQRNIRIIFSSPWYLSSPLRYQYILSGSQEEWSTPSEVPYIDYTNLSSGHYTFKVRAVTATGEVSNYSEIDFRVLPPWYFRWQALVVYFVLAVGSLILVRHLVIQKIIRDKLALQQKLRKRQEEALRKESEQNERNLMVLRNEQLSQELELKARQLANAAANIVYKNELLNSLHQELSNLKDRNGEPLSAVQTQKIKMLLDNARSDERDWDIFEESFNEAHEDFFKKLKSDFPNLTPNDLKLCAYLRLHMASKDIASLLNISTRGVEVRRYRLRKKFGLPTEKNLTEFLLER